MEISDEKFKWHMSYLPPSKYDEVRELVAYLKMGGYHFPTENPMREVVWVYIQVKNGCSWNWESQRWEKNDEVV